jgi:hypothetical protein
MVLDTLEARWGMAKAATRASIALEGRARPAVLALLAGYVASSFDVDARRDLRL